MEMNKLHEYHQTISQTALALSETADKLMNSDDPIARDVHRQMKAQLRVMIDTGIEVGQILERADVEDDTDPLKYSPLGNNV